MIATLLTSLALLQDVPAPRPVPREVGDFAVASLSLEQASLADACAALSAASLARGACAASAAGRSTSSYACRRDCGRWARRSRAS